MSLKKLPLTERPRERLRTYGPEALSVVELLAIILATGTQKASVLELSRQLFSHFGSLSRLIQASIEELMEIKGIGPAKAIQLKAALALAQKASQENHSLAASIDSSKAYELVRFELQPLKQEALLVILKDVKGRLIGIEKVSIGTLSEVLVHPREIFFPAVRHKANSIILAHNHPSGDPTPSKADIDMTRHLIHSSRVMGIHLEDHLIVGADRYISLKQAGYFESARLAPA